MTYFFFNSSEILSNIPFKFKGFPIRNVTFGAKVKVEDGQQTCITIRLAQLELFMLSLAKHMENQLELN